MPGANLPPADALLARLTAMERAIQALQTQQQFVVSNPDGTEPVVAMGCFPGSTISYGMQVYDSSDNIRAEIGKFINGDYGVLVSDTSGNTQEVLPEVTDYVSSALTCSSTTPASIAGSPSVTIVTGATGDYLITAGAYVGTPTGGTATAYVVIDGGSPHSIFGLGGSGANSGNPQSTRQGSTWLTTLTPNVAHTFTMKYATSTGTSTFGANYLAVRPI